MPEIANQNNVCRISDLSFTSCLVIWSLRRGVHQPGNAEALKRTFERTFGADGVDDALMLFGQLVGGLRRGLKLPPDIRAPEDGNVSYQEVTLLSLLAAFQHQTPADARRLIVRMFHRDQCEAFAAFAAGFADALLKANQVLPPDGRGEGTIVPLSPRTRPRKKLAQPVEPGALTAQEAVIVTGIRIWVRALKQGGSPHAVLRAHFDEWGVAEATSSLNAVMNHTGRCATRAFDVRCPKCPGVSADEARVLSATAAMQRGDRVAAMGLLLAWLPSPVVQLTIAALEGLARVFTEARAELPQRRWRFDETAQLQPGTADGTEGAQRPTLH